MSLHAIYTLWPGTKYAVQLRSKVGDQTSAWSQVWYFTTITDNQAPPVPEGVLLTAVGDSFHGEFDVIPTSPKAGRPNYWHPQIRGYEIEFSTTGKTPIMTSRPQQAYVDGGNNKIMIDISRETNAAMWGGTAVANMSMRVRSFTNNGVRSAWSGYSTAEKQGPAAPTNVVATVDGSIITLTWTAPPGEIAKYKVYASGIGSGFPVNDSTNKVWEGQGTSYTHIADTYASFTFAVVAVDNFGLFSPPAYSNTVMTANPFPGDNTPPGAPTIVSGSSSLTNNSNGVGGKAVLTWTQPSPFDDLAEFNVKYRKNGTSDPYVSTVVNADTYTGTDPRTYTTSINVPEAYVAYDFIIRASDWSNNDSTPANITLTPGASTTPGAPTLSGSPSSNNISYSWTMTTIPTDLKHYELEVSTVNTFASTIFSATTGTARTVTVGGLSTNQIYYARVRAVTSATTNAIGPWSATNTTTTLPAPTVTTVTADMIKAGTGNQNKMDSGGVIDIEAGTSLRFNGGHIRSNTYVDSGGTQQTTYQPNNAVAGFWIGNTGLHIASGAVKASTLTTGTLDAATITMGTSGYIQTSGYNGTAGFRLSSNGLEIPNGSISAAKVSIQSGANIVHPAFADFEWIAVASESFYTNGMVKTGLTTAWDSTNKRYNSRSALVTVSSTTNELVLRPNGAGTHIDIDPLETYIVSAWVRSTVAGTRTGTLSLRYNASVDATGTFSFNGDGTWQRISTPVTISTTPTTKADLVIHADQTGDYNIDGIQVEPKTGGTNVPSPWRPPGLTTIDGGMIQTGSIQSNTYINGEPYWTIPLNGSATFQNLLVRGSSVVGVDGSSGAGSVLRSGVFSNPTSGGGSGWQLNSNGLAEFSQAVIKGTIVSGDILSGSFATTSAGNRIIIKSGDFYGYTNAGVLRFFYGYGGESESTTPGIGARDDSGDHRLQLASGIAPSKNYSANIVLRPGSSSSNTRVTIDSGTFYSLGPFYAQLGVQADYNIIQTGGSTTLLNTTVNGLTVNNTANIDGVLFANAGARILLSGGGSTGNVYADGNNTFYKAPNSSIKVKENVRPLLPDPEKLISLQPRRFDYKEGQLSEKFNRFDIVGFIAEEADELGLEDWVIRGEDGEVENFAYQQWVVAGQAIDQWQQEQIESIKAELELVKQELAVLKA